MTIVYQGLELLKLAHSSGRTGVALKSSPNVPNLLCQQSGIPHMLTQFQLALRKLLQSHVNSQHHNTMEMLLK